MQGSARFEALRRSIVAVGGGTASAAAGAGTARSEPAGVPPQREQYWNRAAFLLIAIVAATAFATVADYAVTNDEEVQHRYGEMIVDYYASGLVDRSLFEFKNLYLYGGLFDIIAVLLAKALPVEPYLLRHVLCTAAGIGGIVATFATARLVGGARAGFLAALALTLTAPWYGAMFHHTKDIPFATAMMAAMFFLLRAARDLPAPRWRDMLGFGLALGAALGLRAIGLLLIGYAGLMVLAALLPVARQRPADAVGFAFGSAAHFVPAVALGWAIMLAAWPWAALDPLNPLRAIQSFAHFHYEIRTVLAGTVYEMAEVPRWYVPAYLAIRVPLVVWAGALAAALLACLAGRGEDGRPRWRREICWLWFFAAFPVACEVIGNGPAFTGMRHFTFVVPALAALCGIGIDVAITRLEAWRRPAMQLAAAGIILAFAWQAVTLVRLHPYQYVYYNALVGGVPGAFGRYEMDYWVTVMPEAVRGLKAYVATLKDEPPDRRYTVGVCGEQLAFEREAGPRFEWTNGWYESDFYVSPTQMGCDGLTNGNVVVRIERLGVLLGVVKDRRGFPPPSTLPP